MSSTAQASGKSGTQRRRLLDSTLELMGERGHAGASIVQITAHAGVARPDFYKQFADREACLLEAVEEIHATTLGRIRDAIESRAPEHAAAAATDALLTLAESDPTTARLLMSETLAGGPALQDTRDHSVDQIAQLLERAHRQAPATATLPDIDPAALIGGVMRLLSTRLAGAGGGGGRRRQPAVRQDLRGWVDSYRAAGGERHWSRLSPARATARSRSSPKAPRGAPAALAVGRRGPSPAALAENRRQRILFAAAETIATRGFDASTINEIMQLAGLDRSTFYRLFTGKTHVLAAIHEEAFQQSMAITAGAFFAQPTWPQRVWEAGRAFAGHIEENPTLLRASLLQGNAGGVEAVQRAQELTGAFTIFLQEGHQYETRRRAPSPLALEAVAHTGYEIIYRQARAERNPRVAGLLGHLAHVALAPFLGAARASEVIDELDRDGRGVGRPRR